MIVTVNRIDTDEPVSKELDVTQEQIDAWQSGELVQVAFPNLSISDREFLKSLYVTLMNHAFQTSKFLLKTC